MPETAHMLIAWIFHFVHKESGSNAYYAYRKQYSHESA